MKEYKLSNKNEKILDQLVADGIFKSPEAALNDAVANYLSGLRQQGQAVNVIIDPRPADDGASKTQKQWIAYFNNLGEQMFSAPDIYQAGKSASDEVLDSLKKDFDESWVVSSTRIKYNPTDLSAHIVHNFGSTIVQPTEADVSIIPVYAPESLTKALQKENGVKYLQALFTTTDNPKTITEVLENISKRKAEGINLWTPSQSSRNPSYPERAVRFYGYDSWFRVDGSNFGDGSGRSRWASVSPRNECAKK